MQTSLRVLQNSSLLRLAGYCLVIVVAAGIGYLLASKYESLEKIPLPIILACGIFGVTYIAILSEKVHRTIAGICGAVAMGFVGHWMGFYSQSEAVAAIDWYTIGLLFAMMVIVGMLKKTGFFEYLAIITAKKTMGDPWRLTILLGVVTTVVSMMIDNVTTVVVIAPVTVAICEIIGINPIPILLSEALLSDVGGVATLVGDPPNMIIGSVTGLSFNSFIIHLGPPVLLSWVVCLLVLRLVLWKELSQKPKNIEGLLKMNARGAITDMASLKKVLIALGIIIGLFFFQSKLGLFPSSIAMFGVAIALIWVRPNPDEALMEVHWSVLLFFIALFICVGGIEKAGVLEILGSKIAAHAHSNPMLTCAMLFWVAAISSAIVDNIPFTIAMVPVIQHLETEGVAVMPLWWALAMGVGFGGNGTPIGSTANIVTVAVSERTKYPITMRVWLKAGTTTMVACCIMGMAFELIFFDFYQ
ncbi:MAG: ArsB/NhaD family transporter [Candidatus Brocadiales bacterium]|nr:ArsB/NhaD family transporter [Candidatus Bathyanammoxibius sp.]